MENGPANQPRTIKYRCAATAVALSQRLRRLDRRSALAVFDQAVVSGTTFLTVLIIGRFCGPEGLGLFALAMSALVLVNGAMASLVSTPYTVFRARTGSGVTPAHRAGATLAGALLLIGLVTLLAILSATIMDLCVSLPSVASISWALVFTIPLYLGREFARRYDFAHMKMASALLVDAGVALLQTAALLTLGLRGQLTAATAMLVIGTSCGIVLVLWAVRRGKEFAPQGKHATTRSIGHDWLFGRWLFADHLICVSQLYVTHWLLTALDDTSATGIFAACGSLAALANPLLQGVGNYLSPRFAETVTAGSRTQTMRLYWRTTGVLAVAVTVFTSVAVFLGTDLLRLFYPHPAYEAYGFVVGLLASRLLFAVPTIAADHAVVAMEYPRGCIAATLAGLVTTVCLAIPLIILLGIAGAAIAMLIGTFAESTVMLSVFTSRLREWDWKEDMWSESAADETEPRRDALSLT